MAETCIVCLGDLRTIKDEQSTEPPTSPHPTHLKSTSPTNVDEEIIAHLLPCGHNLHDSCLKPWVERANSCPTCRTNFSKVERKGFLDGPTISTYDVEEKRQVEDIDPATLIENGFLDYEEADPCIMCGGIDEEFDKMWCDGCDRACHIHCSGTDGDIPDVWYCPECQADEAMIARNERRRNRAARAARTPTTSSRTSRGRRRARVDPWARVWQSVWDRLNFDLDFPFDDTVVGRPRNQARRRELNAWQQRLQVATRQGAATRFRDTAPTLLEQSRPAPETQEEVNAWDAFDKARDMQDDGARPLAGRKRKSAEASPASPAEIAAQERKLKRPRIRRPQNNDSTTAEASASSRPTNKPSEGPSFLTNLLQEVERQAPSTDHSSPDGNLTDGQISGALSSPAGSPILSNHATPRAASVTPPPLALPRPSSPTPLTSIVRPMISPTTQAFSPFSPAENSPQSRRAEQRGRQNSLPGAAARDSSPQSPSRQLSFSTKSEIQRMVKNALGARYRNHEISKDQYTDINRDVSRMLYDQVGDAEGLANHESREKWQQMANDEVDRALKTLKTSDA